MSVFFCEVKRLLRNPIVWLFLLCMPAVITWAVKATSGLGTASYMKVGVVDLDGSALSGALVRQMQMRYNCIAFSGEEEIAPALSDQDASWILVIPGGYQADLLNGRAPALEGAALELSDLQFAAAASAESITRALLTLSAGADEAELGALIPQWEEASGVSVTHVEVRQPWGAVKTWINFYAWAAILSAFFMVKVVMEDRRRGLPWRVGVLPMSRRRYLLQCVLAVFLVGEVAALLLLGGVRAVIGYPLPNFWHLLLLVSIYNLFATGLSVALFSLIRRESTVSFVLVMMSTLMSMLGGTYWPVEMMPEFMQQLAMISPNYWFDRALTGMERITPGDFWLPVFLIFCFTAVVFLLGSWRSVPSGEES